jgi:hypothetical protein
MFSGHKITQEDIDIIKTYDTSKVKSFTELFRSCDLPAEIDLSGLDMSAATECTSMFYNNPNLRYVNVDGISAPGLGWNFANALMSANMERIDFSKNDTAMTASYSTNSYPNTISV